MSRSSAGGPYNQLNPGTWYAPGSSGNYGGTFSAGVVTEFKEASYLLDTYLAGVNLTQAHAIASTVGDVQFAIWYIMAGGSVSGGVASGATGINLTLTSGAISDIIQAQNHYTDIGLLLNPVFVPADGTIQSFMLNPSSPVPLPPTVLLLVPGLLGLGVMRKRYKL